MKTYTITELKKDTSTVFEQMTLDGYTLITQNGKPKTLMLDVEQADIENSIVEVRWLRARQAVTNMRSKVQGSGTANLELDDINKIIADVRGSK